MFDASWGLREDFKLITFADSVRLLPGVITSAFVKRSRHELGFALGVTQTNVEGVARRLGWTRFTGLVGLSFGFIIHISWLRVLSSSRLLMLSFDVRLRLRIFFLFFRIR